MTQVRTADRLERSLGPISATGIVVANMIGTGIFTTSGLLLRDVGDPLLLLGLWAAGGVIALCGALCYAELGAAMPEAGGEYAFLTRLFHPLLGFLTGWVSLFAGFSAPIAAAAIGIAEYVTRAVSGEAGVSPALKTLCAVLVILVFTGLHYRGLTLGVRMQNGLTALKLALIFALLAAGFAVGRGDWTHFAIDAGSAQGDVGPRTLGLALMWVMFAYSGWNAAAYLGSEIREPTRNLPLSLLLGTGVVTTLYLLLNALYVYAVPPPEMSGVIPIGGLAVTKLFGRVFDPFVSAAIGVALCSSLSAFIILGPRVLYSMAVDKAFFRFAGDVHPRFRVPSKAIVLQGLVAIVIVLAGRFEQILTYMGFSLGIFPLLAVIGVFKLRRAGTVRFRAPGFPFVPVVYVLASGAILVLAYLERPVESTVSLATVAAGIPAYLIFRRTVGANR